jgi:uncharacterized protein (TIGR04255 family)
LRYPELGFELATEPSKINGKLHPVELQRTQAECANGSDKMPNVTSGLESPKTASDPGAPFAERPRVVYKRNPLIEVVCQLKFPPILRIDTEPPAKFQECIRDRFPVLTERDADLAFPAGLPPQVASMLRSSFGKQPGTQLYNFATVDSGLTLQLTRDYISLTTTQYQRWDEFKGHLHYTVQALLDVYKPAFFTRLGLRYQDLIQRSKLELQTLPWSTLLTPRIAGLVGAEGFVVGESLSIALIKLTELDAYVRLRHGLAQKADTSEECYLIDSDFYTEQRTDTNDVYRKLDYFNRLSFRLFRWCIEERLHDAMEPEPVVAPVSL